MLNTIFYRKFYSDLKDMNQKQLIQHWKYHGSKEGRIPNLKTLKIKQATMLNDNLKIINNTSRTSNNFEFTIIIRTHNRPTEFKKSLDSVLNQTYKNFNIIVGYDNLETFDYLKEYSNILKIRKFKKSNNTAYFDEYFNQLYNHVKENTFIIMLDDDNQFISDKCLEFLNTQITNKINILKFISTDKEIYPNDFKNIKYGELDSACICFHSSLIGKAIWDNKYGSDFKFITDLIKNDSYNFINVGLISTQYKNINNHFNEYNNKYSQLLNKKISSKRIDFNDYLNYYPDLKKVFGNNLKLAQKHYENTGYKESRIIKFKDFNWDKFNKIFVEKLNYGKIEEKIILITSLYNETNINRLNEFICCLKFNLDNPNIEQIIIYYDISKGKNKTLEEIFIKYDKIKIIETSNRPNYLQLAKNIPQNKIGLICNADIIYDDSLQEIFYFDLTNTIIGLTRWDFIDEKTAIPRRDYIKKKLENPNDTLVKSTDTWIMKGNIIQKYKDFEKIELGTWNCDVNFVDLCLKNKINYISECYNIKSYHIHFSNCRNYKM